MRAEKEIELFGHKVRLAERNASEVLTLIEYVRDSKEDVSTLFAVHLNILEGGLRLNRRRSRPWNFWKVRKWNRQFTAKYLRDNLPFTQVFNLAEEVQRLEGFDFDENGKKKQESQSQEALSGQ